MTNFQYVSALYHLKENYPYTRGSGFLGSLFFHLGPLGAAVKVTPGWDAWLCLVGNDFKRVSQECDAIRAVELALFPKTATDFDLDNKLFSPARGVFL